MGLQPAVGVWVQEWAPLHDLHKAGGGSAEHIHWQKLPDSWEAGAAGRSTLPSVFGRGRSRCHVWTECVHLLEPAPGHTAAVALAVYSDQSRYAGQPAVTLHRYLEQAVEAAETVEAAEAAENDPADGGRHVWYISTHLGAADLSRFMLSVCATVGAASPLPPPCNRGPNQPSSR